jgi:hypothetical protein
MPESELDTELWNQVAAERAIQRVLLEYGRGVDERDFARIRACFHDDAVITYGDRPGVPLDEALAWLEEVVPALHGLSHYFGPPIVDISEGGDEAVCQTWCINTVMYPREGQGKARQEILGLLYDDRFVRRAGLWRIVERRNQSEWCVDVEDNKRVPLPGLR